MIHKINIKQVKTAWLASLILLGCFSTLAAVAQAQPQAQQSRIPGGPPTVTITDVQQVTNRIPTFIVKWTTTVPRGTTILDFNVKLDVRFNNGGTKTVSKTAEAAATSVTLQFPDQPPGVVAQSFDALINTRFKTPERNTISVTREFDLKTTDIQGGVGSGGTLPPDRPLVQIAGAEKESLGRTKVRWNVQSVPEITIEKFGVSGLVTFGFKQTQENPVPPVTLQSEVSIAPGTAREAVVVVNKPPEKGSPSPIRIKVQVDTVFFAPVIRTIQSTKRGTF
ncbi:MAG TPA: hypothetical protein VJS64_02875 [Pyrinomonadaceae bacterium]|nr:hypothetical protein [Pyrinomonadaceae bacterium]